MIIKCLKPGKKDAMTPLFTILLSFVINLLGAATAVYLLKSPVVAVAISTVVAQWAGACFILQRVSQQQVGADCACKERACVCSWCDDAAHARDRGGMVDDGRRILRTNSGTCAMQVRAADPPGFWGLGRRTYLR